MAQLLVRDLTEVTLDRLKRRAKEHGRSLQAEAKTILEAAAPLGMEEAARVAAQWRRRLAGRMKSDSADLLREDRSR
jgi:plasmid stability protein